MNLISRIFNQSVVATIIFTMNEKKKKIRDLAVYLILTSNDI